MFERRNGAIEVRFQFFIFLLLITGSGGCRPSSKLEDRKGDGKERLADIVLKKSALRIKQEMDLHPIGTMGQMHGQIKKLGLSFYCYQPLDIVEGRKLLMRSIHIMFEEIEEEERIRPYLDEYPFPLENIEITIFIFNPDGRNVTQGNLCTVKNESRKFTYKIKHPITNRLAIIYRETFKEAMERLDDPSLPLVACLPDPEITPEEMARLRQGVSFVSNDGSIWHLDGNGSFVPDPPKP